MTLLELGTAFAAMRDDVARELHTDPNALAAVRQTAAEAEGLPDDFHASVLEMMQSYHNRAHTQSVGARAEQ